MHSSVPRTTKPVEEAGVSQKIRRDRQIWHEAVTESCARTIGGRPDAGQGCPPGSPQDDVPRLGLLVPATSTVARAVRRASGLLARLSAARDGSWTQPMPPGPCSSHSCPPPPRSTARPADAALSATCATRGGVPGAQPDPVRPLRPRRRPRQHALPLHLSKICDRQWGASAPDSLYGAPNATSTLFADSRDGPPLVRVHR